MAKATTSKIRIMQLIAFLCFAPVMGQFGEQQIISTVTEKPYISIPVDIDNDGFIDVLTASGETYKMSWYKNLDGAGNFGSETIINETSVYYLSIDFVDLDTDGDKDILHLSNNANYIAWLENLDGAGNFGPEQIIIETNFTMSVTPIDMDNDGDQDLVAVVTDTFTGWIVWYENLDGQGTFGEENMLIQNDSEFIKILLVDIDNDGKLDILATDIVLWGGSIFWYKNLGNATFDAAQVIYQFAYVQSGGTNIIEFQYVDINTDEKKDIVMTSVDDNSFIRTHWLENLDNQGSFGDLQFIMDTNDQYLFYDFDNDSDNDMLLWNRNTNSIAWKENHDSLGTFSEHKTITTEVDFPRDAKAADLDGDGMLDVVSASLSDDKLAWYKNILLGVPEYTSKNFNIYPNPTKGLINVESTETISEIQVYNTLGQHLKKNSISTGIDLSNLKSGIYFFKITTTNGQSETHKIVKQ